MYGKGSYTRESTFLRELDPKLLEGDGVYVKKEDVRFGESKPLGGYEESRHREDRSTAFGLQNQSQRQKIQRPSWRATKSASR